MVKVLPFTTIVSSLFHASKYFTTKSLVSKSTGYIDMPVGILLPPTSFSDYVHIVVEDDEPLPPPIIEPIILANLDCKDVLPTNPMPFLSPLK